MVNTMTACLNIGIGFGCIAGGMWSAQTEPVTTLVVMGIGIVSITVGLLQGVRVLKGD